MRSYKLTHYRLRKREPLIALGFGQGGGGFDQGGGARIALGFHQGGGGGYSSLGL